VPSVYSGEQDATNFGFSVVGIVKFAHPSESCGAIQYAVKSVLACEVYG